jgi:hypothetical protein
MHAECSPRRAKEGCVPFISIASDDYTQLYPKFNSREAGVDLRARIQHMIDFIKAGKRCDCGDMPRAVGSALTGLACFPSITGETMRSLDDEIDDAPPHDGRRQSEPETGCSRTAGLWRPGPADFAGRLCC